MRELDSQEPGRRERNWATGARFFARNLTISLVALGREGARLAFRFVAERCRQNAIRALQHVDDRMLADIGVPRGTFELALQSKAA